MEDSKDWENIAKHLKGETTPQEQEELLIWRKQSEENESIFKEAERIWNLSELSSEEYAPNVSQAWEKFKVKVSEENKLEEEVKESKIFPFLILKVAAAIIILFGIGYFIYINQFKDQLINHQTASKETKEIHLPDGSIVWLNKNSRISYLEDFTDRIVNLSGEAFFEVKKSEGRRFTILSNSSKTEVLGTQFNVRAYNNEPEVQVTVITGKVSFSRKNNTETIFLEPGDKGLLENGNKIIKTVTDNNNETAWKTKQLAFDNTSLNQVFKTLENYFGTKILVNSGKILECRFTGTFDNPDLNQIIEVLSISVDIKHQKQGETYYFVGSGCK